MKVTGTLVLLCISVGSSECSLKTAFRIILERDIPTGRSVCFFNTGWAHPSDLQAFAMQTTSKVSFIHFDPQKSMRKTNVSRMCAVIIVLLSKTVNPDKLFRSFEFDKYSQFIIINSKSANSLNIAKFLLKQGITNVLFLEQTCSSENLFLYDLFPNKRSTLTKNLYNVIVLYSDAVDIEVDHTQYMKQNVLKFISSYQNATISLQKMYEKSPKVLNSSFDVIIPYFEDYIFESHSEIEQVFLPMTVELCLIVPKVRNPQYLKMLFRPFRFQLWALVLIGHGLFELVRKLRHRFYGKLLEGKLPSFENMQRLGELFILFILCESYSAKLTAFLNSPIDTVYPQTVDEFRSSPIQLLIPNPEWLVYARMIPALDGKYVLFEQSTKYDWSQVALFGTCNMFEDKTVPKPQSYKGSGVVLSSSRYHVIKEPLLFAYFSLLFNKRSPLEKATRDIIRRMYQVGLLQRLMKERKHKAGEGNPGEESNLLLAFNGFDPLYRTIGRVWIASVCLFILQWIHVLYLRQVHYNIVFLVGLNVFLRN